MTKEKLESTLAGYRKHLLGKGARDESPDYDKTNISNAEAYDHLLSMIIRAESLLEKNKIEKVFRWLGFIQGTLWMTGDFSLDELKNNSRPDNRKK